MPIDRWVPAWMALWLALPGLTLAAASPSLSPSGGSYNVQVWGTEDGLPQSSVIAMTQTRDGYLWLGTLNGLVRFDGIRFTVFDESNTPGLGSSRIVNLFEDEEGNRWIGTETAGVVLIKRNGQVTGLDIGRGSREGRLMSACQDAIGAVWLYTADGQLCRYLGGRIDIWRVGAERYSNVRSVIAEAQGPVWVGMDWSQFALKPSAVVSQHELPVETNVNSRVDLLFASRTGGYWRLADGQIQKWVANRLERNLGPYPWKNVRVAAACEDHQGNLLVGTLGAGLFWFDPAGKVTSLSTNEGLSHNYVLSLLVDREGSLWVGTDGGGLNRIKRQIFGVLDESRRLVVQSVSEDEQGGLWIGSHNDGVIHWKDGLLHQALPMVPVWSVFVDRSSRVWAGTRGRGLFLWQENRFLPMATMINREVTAIHQDRSGRLWLGTRSGLARWDENGWKVFTLLEGLAGDPVRAITDDRAGALWVGTEGGGLKRLRQDKLETFRKGEGLPSDDISSLLADDEGVIWVGTRGHGLVRFHDGKWTRYTTREGLVSQSVGYLIEDGQGNFWIGSNAGLMRVPKKALNDYARDATTFIPWRVYGKADGLPAAECTLGSQPGGIRARDGRLWFPTIKGLAFVDPARLKPNTNPPPVVIESVLLDGEVQNTNAFLAIGPQTINVPSGKERLEIHYTSLNLASPDRARFKYRLAGHETGWIEAGNIRVARYSKLPPDRYRFQVTACNEDGLWNETGGTLSLLVQPPFWRTWWFLSAMAVCLLGAIVVLVHYFSTQRLQRQLEMLRRQEAIEKERARIARDIHDQLGASMTQLSLLGEMVESDKGVPDEVELHGRQISRTALDTTRVLDEIVWTVNPSNDTLEGLVNYVCKYAQDYLAVAGLRYRLDVPAQLPDTPIPPDVRHNIFLASKEAVTNIVRHAQATAVLLRLRLDADRFTIEIEDDGRGPAGMEGESGRNGLRNMRKRMEDIGGAFSISPGSEKGSRVSLMAPLEKG